MARRWSKEKRTIYGKWRSYKKRLKNFGEKYGIDTGKGISYSGFSEIYRNREQEVSEGTRKSVGDVGGYLIQRADNPKVLYKKYKERLEKRVDYLISRGISPNDAFPVDFENFKQSYSEYRSDFEKEVEKGERTQRGDIIGRMVSDQVYKMSSKQYEETMRAIKEYNEHFPEKAIELPENFNPNSIYYQMKIRQGDYLQEAGWWDLVESKRQEYYKKYLETYKGDKIQARRAANREVRKTLYGSPI